MIPKIATHQRPGAPCCTRSAAVVSMIPEISRPIPRNRASRSRVAPWKHEGEQADDDAEDPVGEDPAPPFGDVGRTEVEEVMSR